MIPEASNFQPAEPLIDFGHYLKAVKDRWFSIALFTLLCTAISVLISFSIAPTYQATATLLIEASQRKAVSIEQVVGIDSRAKEYYQTQFEILKSNRVAQRVIEDLALTELVEFNPSLELEPSLSEQLKDKLYSLPLLMPYAPAITPLTSEQQHILAQRNALQIFKEKLTIEPIKKTQLVKIHFESNDPILAAKIANQVGYAYIEVNMDSKLSATHQATDWINTRVNELKTKLERSEQALLDFLHTNQLIDDSGISALTSTELTNLTERLSKVTEQRIQSQALYSALKQNQNANLSTLSSISVISNHPQVRDIRLAEIQAEKHVSELSKRYGSKHDKMIQAKAQLESIQKRAALVVAKLVRGVHKELLSARQQEKLLKNELNSKKGEFQDLALVKGEYDALKREVSTNTNLYNLFLTRQKETSATSDFASTNTTFSDFALIPEHPSKPQKKLIVAITIVMSVMFACTIVVLLDVLKNTIESQADFEKKFGLLPLGVIPAMKNSKTNIALINDHVLDQQTHLFNESFDSVRTSLNINMLNNQRKTIAVTSAMASEGKSTAAIKLANSFSKLERVLLIDCDMRKPTIAKKLGFAEHCMGINNHLLMNTPINECIHTLEDSALEVLPVGMLSPNPQEALSSAKFHQLISQLEDQYDRIIIDTPPTLPINDTLIIGGLAGSLLFILKANSTSQHQYKMAINLVSKHGIAIDGVILNQVSPKVLKHEYSSAYYAYAS